MKLEAESDGMQPQAKEHLEPPEAGRDREDSPLGSWRQRGPCQQRDFTLWLPGLGENKPLLF